LIPIIRKRFKMVHNWIIGLAVARVSGKVATKMMNQLKNLKTTISNKTNTHKYQ